MKAESSSEFNIRFLKHKRRFATLKIFEGIIAHLVGSWPFWCRFGRVQILGGSSRVIDRTKCGLDHTKCGTGVWACGFGRVQASAAHLVGSIFCEIGGF